MHLFNGMSHIRNRRRCSVGLVGAFAIILSTAFSAVPARAAAANPAEAFVQQNVDRGYAILNNMSFSDQQRREQFRSFTLSLTDPRRIGMFTLGQYANGASKTDIETFISAFTDYVVATYESRLTKYKNQTLRVTGSIERIPDDVVVNADVVDPNNSEAQPIKVAFRVRKTADGHPIVTDIQVEGIWLAISEREDFTDFLQRHGGSIAVLSQALKVQAE